jgi:hypothetical protein
LHSHCRQGRTEAPVHGLIFPSRRGN